MTSNAFKFNDQFSYRLDAKGRVSIPPRWRAELGEEFAMIRFDYAGDENLHGLKVMPLDSFRTQLAAIDADTRLTPAAAKRYIAKITRKTSEGKLNDQGKLLIPQVVAEWAGLELPGPVELVGEGAHFVLINPKYLDVADNVEDDGTEEANDLHGMI